MDTLSMQGRKWDIFSSAVFLFSEQGYEHVSMRDIAKANGMQVSSLYNHFRSKDELLQTMYEFYSVNKALCEPNLNELLGSTSELPPSTVIGNLTYYYSKELQPYMDRIALLAAMLSRSDERAHRLIKRHLFEDPTLAITSILSKMIEEKRIEPLDIKAFSMIYTNIAFSTAVRNCGQDAIAKEDWGRMSNMLISLLDEQT